MQQPVLWYVSITALGNPVVPDDIKIKAISSTKSTSVSLKLCGSCELCLMRSPILRLQSSSPITTTISMDLTSLRSSRTVLIIFAVQNTTFGLVMPNAWDNSTVKVWNYLYWILIGVVGAYIFCNEGWRGGRSSRCRELQAGGWCIPSSFRWLWIRRHLFQHQLFLNCLPVSPSRSR